MWYSSHIPLKPELFLKCIAWACVGSAATVPAQQQQTAFPGEQQIKTIHCSTAFVSKPFRAQLLINICFSLINPCYFHFFYLQLHTPLCCAIPSHKAQCSPCLAVQFPAAAHIYHPPKASVPGMLIRTGFMASPAALVLQAEFLFGSGRLATHS